MMVFVLLYQRSAPVIFKAPENVDFSTVCEQFEQQWKFLKAAAFNVTFQISLKDIWSITNEEEWQEFLSSISNKQMRIRLRAVPIGKSFSGWNGLSFIDLQPVLKKCLGVDLAGAAGVPVDASVFQSEDISADRVILANTTYSQLIDSIVVELSLKMAAMPTVANGLEISQRDFISPILVAAVLVARVLGPEAPATARDKDLLLQPEYHIIGSEAWGPIDYVIYFCRLVLIVAEAKRHNLDQAWGQLVMEISASRDSLMRRLGHNNKKRNNWQVTEMEKLPTLAILCQADQYRLVRYEPQTSRQQASLVQSHPFYIPLSVNTSVGALREAVEALVRGVAYVIVQQMQSYVEAIVNNPRLQTMTADPVAGSDVIAQEVQESSEQLEAYTAVEADTDEEWLPG